MQLLTLAKYNALTPYQQGYARYMQAAWPDSPIPDVVPYAEGTPEYAEFMRGDFAAMLYVQECES